MVQILLPMLPKEVGALGLIVAVAGTLAGVLLWLVGARFSRPLITLCTVFIGAAAGMMLPRWFEWSVTGMGPAVAGAIGLGISGYVFHRFWVGMGLGLVLTCWVALGTWTLLNNGHQWAWPEATEETTVGTYLTATWESVPKDVSHAMPFTCATAMLSGLVAGMLWPRVGLVMLYSLAGVSLLVGMGVAAIENGRPQWISIIPAEMSSQLCLLVALVTFGATVQWWQMSAPAGEKEAKVDDD
jgi:hypothetical protein